MRLLYVNDVHAFVSEDETRGAEPYDVRDIVARATTVRGARDFIQFLMDTPGSFFRWDAFPLRRDFMTLAELVGRDVHEPLTFKESFVDVIDRHFPEVEALDEVAVKAGAIGTYVEDHEPVPLPDDTEETVGVVDVEPLSAINLEPYEILVQNVQLLERYAAIANGERSTFEIRRMDMGCAADVQFVDTQLWAYREYATGYAQSTICRDLFTNDEWQQVRAALIARGYDDFLRPTEATHDTLHGTTPIGVYPASWSDQEVATDVFLAFLNSFSTDDEDERYLNQPFLVSRDGNGFHVRDNIAPLSACYREVAYLAEANVIRTCAFCGRPLLADRSRGNEAMYCSRSCNTQASAQRRETAYALAASGAPIERAVERIGARYEQSIRRWYEEARALLD